MDIKILDNNKVGTFKMPSHNMPQIISSLIAIVEKINTFWPPQAQNFFDKKRLIEGKKRINSSPKEGGLTLKSKLKHNK